MKFFNEALSPNSAKKLLPSRKNLDLEKQFGNFKIIFYGPAICGLTIKNQVQFTVDIILKSNFDSLKQEQIKILCMIYDKLYDNGFADQL